MNSDIKETRGEDERGAYAEVSGYVNGEKIGKVVYHTGDATLDAQALDLSRFSAAPSARLCHFPFEGDRAFPAQC